jgi:hypothetical protein
MGVRTAERIYTLFIKASRLPSVCFTFLVSIAALLLQRFFIPEILFFVFKPTLFKGCLWQSTPEEKVVAATFNRFSGNRFCRKWKKS